MAMKERPNKPKKKARAKAKPKKSTRAMTPPKPKVANQSPPSPRRRAVVTKPPPSRPRVAFLKVGIHAGVSHLRYHEDPAPEPSMSSSFLRKVYETSPAHAWLTHPRLAKNYQPDQPTRDMDFGSAAHAHLLGSQEIQIVKATDWRKESSRVIRDGARRAGLAPVLIADAERIGHMVRKLKAGLKATELAGVFDLGLGENEAVAIWRDEGVYFRARADRWIPPAPGRFPHGLIVDYKTTGDSAAAEDWSRNAFNIGADWQSVLYPIGFMMAAAQSTNERHPFTQPPAFRYVVQETFEPFEFQVFAPSLITREHTTSKISAAFALAHAALKTAEPPGYPRLTAELDPPAWELKRAERAALTAQAMWKP